MPVGIALIHAEQIAGEQSRLLAAGPGAQFENGALLVGGILGQELQLQLPLQRLDLGVDRFKLCFRKRGHLAVGGRLVDQRLQIGTFLGRAPELVDGGDDRIELGEFAGEPHIALLIGAGGKGALHRLPTGDELVEVYPLGWSSWD